MSINDLETRFLLLRPYIIEAGIKIKSMRDRNELKIQTKKDGSLVTNADEWGNVFLCKHIRQLYPKETVIGEESSDKSYKPGTKHVWYVDPVDGTTNYTNNSKDYFILVGYCHDGVPLLGIHYQPETGQIIYGYKGITPKLSIDKNKSQPIKIAPAFWNGSPRVHIKTKDPEIRNQVTGFGVKKAVYTKGMADMIAPLFKKSEGYVSFRSNHYWDVAAPAAIMRSAGFHIAANDQKHEYKSAMNDGNVRTNFFYSLPPDVPKEFVDHLKQINQNRR